MQLSHDVAPFFTPRTMELPDTTSRLRVCRSKSSPAMPQCGARFSLKARHEFEIRAKEHRARKTSELSGEMEALLTQARLLSMREQEESEVDGPICMCCRD